MKKLIFITLCLSVLCALLCIGCGKEEKTPAQTVPPISETQTPGQTEPGAGGEALPQPGSEAESEAEDVDPEFMNPLTGLAIEEEFVHNRPCAVMFNNILQAQPQYGISQADIIFEVCAEGGITRMVALYQDLSRVGNLGSIRSARPYYVEIARSFDAIYIHAGGSDAAYDYLSSSGLTHYDGVRGDNSSGMFWRDSMRVQTHGYEHSLFITGSQTAEILAADDIRRDHEADYQYEMTYAADATPANGADATQVSVEFSGYKTGTFEYDEETRLYGASQYGGPHIDGANGQQVTTSNLLVLYTDIVVLDDAGRLSVTVNGSGSGLYFCGGKAVEINWEKEAGGQFYYTLTDGTPLTLERGRSYVCIIQKGNDVIYS